MVLRLVDSLLQLANARFEAGALHDARRILANVISQPNIRRRQLVKGLVMCAAVDWSLGNSKTSEQHARLAVKLAPYSASAHLALAIALLGAPTSIAGQVSLDAGNTLSQENQPTADGREGMVCHARR